MYKSLPKVPQGLQIFMASNYDNLVQVSLNHPDLLTPFTLLEKKYFFMTSASDSTMIRWLS